MKRTDFTTALTSEEEEWDQEDAIDVFYPDFDMLPHETPVTFNLRYAFTCAGYRVGGIEEIKTHPVIVVRAVSKDAKLFPDHRLFFQHIQDLLRGSGFRLRRDELTVCQTGNRILIAFQSGAPSADIQEILRELHEELANDGDM